MSLGSLDDPMCNTIQLPSVWTSWIHGGFSVQLKVVKLDVIPLGYCRESSFSSKLVQSHDEMKIDRDRNFFSRLYSWKAFWTAKFMQNLKTGQHHFFDVRWNHVACQILIQATQSLPFHNCIFEQLWVDQYLSFNYADLKLALPFVADELLHMLKQ